MPFTHMLPAVVLVGLMRTQRPTLHSISNYRREMWIIASRQFPCQLYT